MSRFVLSLALICFSFAAEASEPYAPSDRDLEIIFQEISKRMLEPQSTIISEVIAADDVVDSGTFTWVCGDVRGRNSYGGYAQPTPFYGVLSDSGTQGRNFVIMSIARPTPSDQLRVRNACLQKISEADPYGGDVRAKTLIQNVRQLNGACRGSSDPTSPETISACEDRDEAWNDLNDQGWCFGRRGEVGYQQSWHRCGPISLK